jgi:hypothetical protein
MLQGIFFFIKPSVKSFKIALLMIDLKGLGFIFKDNDKSVKQNIFKGFYSMTK